MSNYKSYIDTLLEKYPTQRTKFDKADPKKGIFLYMDYWDDPDYVMERLDDLDSMIENQIDLIRKKGEQEGKASVDAMKAEIENWQLEQDALRAYADSHEIETMAKVA